MKDIEVKDSRIHEKGVFAKRDFKKGEKVIDWSECSDVITETDYQLLSKSEKQYVSKIDNELIYFKAPARFVNHSCDANMKSNSKQKSDIATKNIYKGEEVTVNYIDENMPNLNMKCNCGSINCKKIIKLG